MIRHTILKNNLLKFQKEQFILVGCLLVISIFVFQDFFFLKKIYIYTDIGSDTYYSYWPYLSYLSDMLWSGNLSFWSFELGTGNSIFSVSTLLFDPFNWILFLFGKGLLPYLLPYVATLKITLAGLFCYNYLKYIRISNFSSLAISIIYGLNGYIILWGQHYQFATLMVIGILVLYTFERMLQKSKILLFIFSISVFACFSYYFLYMFSIYLFLYAIFRFIELYGTRFKHLLVFYAKLILAYIVGICLSAVIFLPSIYVVLSSPRVGNSNSLTIFKLASIQEYLTFIFRALSNDILGKTNFTGYWNYYEAPVIYTGLISILLLPLFFIYAEKRLKIIYGIFLGIISIFIIFPFFSLVFNGFSAYSYRWTFVIILFVVFLVSRSLDFILLKKVNNKIIVFLCLIFSVIGLVSILLGNVFLNWNKENIKNSTFVFMICLMFYIVYSFHIKYISREKVKLIGKYSLIFFVSIEMALFSFSTINSNRNLLNIDYVNNSGYNDGVNDAINFLNGFDSDFYRIDKGFDSVFLNDSLMQNYRSVKAYNSLNHPSYIQFLRTLDVPFKIKNHPNYITGLDSRKKLGILLGVKYFLDYEDKKSPSGFSYLTTINNINIFKNNYYIPFGFTYDSFIPVEKFAQFNENEKDSIILKSFVSEDENDSSLYSQYNDQEISELKAELSYLNINQNKEKLIFKNIEVNENNFPEKLKLSAKNNDPQILIPLEEIYEANKIKIKLDIDSPITSTFQIFWGTNNKFSEQKSASFSVTPDQKTYSIEINNVVFDSLRLDPTNNEVSISLQNVDISIVIDNGDSLTNDVTKLKQETLKIDEYRSDYVRGNIDLSQNKMLFLSIPYDPGWVARVDGKEVNIKEVNIGFMGLDLEKGRHEIELKYGQPFLKLGLGISSFTLMILILYFIIYRISTHSTKKSLK